MDEETSKVKEIKAALLSFASSINDPNIKEDLQHILGLLEDEARCEKIPESRAQLLLVDIGIDDANTKERLKKQLIALEPTDFMVVAVQFMWTYQMRLQQVYAQHNKEIKEMKTRLSEDQTTVQNKSANQLIYKLYSVYLQDNDLENYADALLMEWSKDGKVDAPLLPRLGGAYHSFVRKASDEGPTE